VLVHQKPVISKHKIIRMLFVEKIAGWVKNKYIIATLFFCVWILFFDHNDLLQQVSRKNELSDLKSSRDYYQAQIELSRNELEELKMNPDALEKIAREKYLMKRDNEQVFVVSPGK
jgi:cell division protein FtsB